MGWSGDGRNQTAIFDDLEKSLPAIKREGDSSKMEFFQFPRAVLEEYDEMRCIVICILINCLIIDV